MAIRLPDPYTNPGEAPGFTNAPLTDNQPIIQDAMPDGRLLQQKSAAQFWSMKISYPELFDMEYRLISSAINEAKRTDDFIEIVLPQHVSYRVQGDESKASIAAGQKGSSLVITNTSGLTGFPYPGDLFKLSTHAKVYKITSVDVSTPNQMTINLYPDLFIDTDGSEKPVFNDIKFQVKLSNRTIMEDVSVDGLYTGITYDFRESL